MSLILSIMVHIVHRIHWEAEALVCLSLKVSPTPHLIFFLSGPKTFCISGCFIFNNFQCRPQFCFQGRNIFEICKTLTVHAPRNATPNIPETDRCEISMNPGVFYHCRKAKIYLHRKGDIYLGFFFQICLFFLSHFTERGCFFGT